jgi:putative membrane protein
MKRTLHGITLATALLAGGVTLAQSAAPAAKPAGKTTEVKGFMVPNDPKAYMERLHYINQAEIKLGQLALTNSMNPDVKSYAQMMVDAHTKADKELMDMATSMKLKLADKPSAPTDLEKKAMDADKAMMEELKLAKGAPFDSCYIASQVGDHDDAIGKVMAGLQAMSANPQATAMLTKLQGELPGHRKMAYDVLGKLPQAMGVGGSGSMGTMDHGSMNKDSMNKDSMGGSTGTMGGSTGSGSMGGSTGSGSTGTMGGSTKTK